MRYCARCLYPENARPTIIFDDDSVCSGCRVFESKGTIDWTGRRAALEQILEHYGRLARESGNAYDCIIPVSGGKDSHYQVYLIKEVFGLNPLLVCYNHIFNTGIGIQNLTNLVERFNCDLVRYTANPESVRKIARYMLRKVGDVTWHYHSGINTLPFQAAVQHGIPLIIWGEHGYSEVTGMFRLEDIPEFTKWCRQEHEMRGFEAHDLINAESGITARDLVPYTFPKDEQIEALGVRGIYLGNYVQWGALEQARFLVENYGFRTVTARREKTFSLYTKIDDHANDVHDYLKYLKFGYGRATDHASLEIRCGRMTREQGIDLVREYDHVRPTSLDIYLDFLGMTERDFEAIVEPMRDHSIWQRDAAGRWSVKDTVVNHVEDPLVDAARLRLVPEDDRTFGKNNRRYYYSPDNPPPAAPAPQRYSADRFVIL